MPRFEPFVALRYAADGPPLDFLVAPPYDVLTDSEIDELERLHEHNIVHVDVPRERDGADRYTRAASTMRRWIADGVLERDDTPAFTIYRMTFDDESGTTREIAGVLGAIEVTDDGAGGVLPHERTTPKASTDRLDLTRATEANLSPVWGLSLASGLTSLLTEPGKTIGSVAVDGVDHSVEVVDDPERVAAISSLVGSDDVLIADGHHRFGIARQYRDEVRAAAQDGDAGAAELTLIYVNELVEDQLSVDAIHRLYSDVPASALREALLRCFDLVEAPDPDETAAWAVAQRRMAVTWEDGTAQWLEPRAEAFDGVRALDGAWLEHALRDIEHTVTYQHGAAEAVAATRGGGAVAAVLIRPVSVAEITRTAREGLLMPPKSTFFTPKLRTGLVIRDLREQ